MILRNAVRTLMTYIGKPPLVQASQARSELQEEIEFHLTSSVQEKIASGMGSRESQESALNKFGDVDSVLRECSEVFNSSQVFWHRMHQGLTVALGCLAIAFGVQLYTQKAANSQLAERVVSATGYSFESTDGDIVGTVVGTRGEAVSSAHVMAVVKSWPPNGYRQQAYMTTTGTNGSFELDNVYSPQHEYEIQVAALADGRLLTSQYTDSQTGRLDPVRIQLQETTDFRLRFESADGFPIEGVCAFPSERLGDDGKRHNVYFSSADQIVQTSNQSGNVSMPHFMPGERATVYVRFPESDWQTREIVVPKNQRVIVMTPSLAVNDHGK